MSLRIAVAERTQVGQARREALALARQLSLDAGTADRLALTVTEAATNLVKHAAGGELLFAPLAHDDDTGVEVIAIDRGPGMRNIGASMRDGESTTGSLGVGLGAMSRLASHLDIYSSLGAGTVLRFEVWTRDSPVMASFGGVCVAKTGESVAGDAWLLQSAHGTQRAMVVDGLGHGTDAAAAARSALRTADQNPGLAPAALLDAVHGALRSTRGAAAAAATVTPATSTGVFAGIGNISCVVHASRARSLVSHNGTLGHQVRKIQPFDFDFPAHALLVMHSDGVSARWSLGAYPGLVRHHPAVIAATLYRDYGRARDDATVVVLRNDTGAKR